MDGSRASSQIGDNSFKLMKKKKTSLETVSCGFPEGSILGLLLFLLYVNNLKNASKTLDPIMFANKTNLFFRHQDLRNIFQIGNKELENINQRFISNKLSPNT